MNLDLTFFKTSMPKSRAADFYLGCHQGSVFMDFNLNGNGLVYLKRISFDGYGCYGIANSEALDKNDSTKFIDEMSKEALDQESIGKLVKQLIKINSEKIRAEALDEYNLI